MNYLLNSRKEISYYKYKNEVSRKRKTLDHDSTEKEHGIFAFFQLFKKCVHLLHFFIFFILNGNDGIIKEIFFC